MLAYQCDGDPSVIMIVQKVSQTTQELLVLADDQRLYVICPLERLIETCIPFNEVVGVETYRACRLPTYRWRSVFLGKEIIDAAKDDWPISCGERLRPREGFYFGTTLLGARSAGCANIRYFGYLPRGFYKKIANRNDLWRAWLVDACLNSVSNRPVQFFQDAIGQYHIEFIDHGILLGGATGKGTPQPDQACYYDGKIYPREWPTMAEDVGIVMRAMNLGRMLPVLSRLPSGWFSSSAYRRYQECADRCSSPGLVLDCANRIFEAHANRTRAAQPFGIAG